MTTDLKRGALNHPRSFPSLNLKLEVDSTQRRADLVLPGLRYDDMDITGKPDILRVYKMMTRVELAAFHNEVPFLDMTDLVKANIMTVTKASQAEMKKEFYDRTVAKAPLAVNLKLIHIGETSFSTLTDFSCGGRMKPSVKVTNIHSFCNVDTGKVIPVPEWWRAKFSLNLPDQAPVIEPSLKSKGIRTRSCMFTVPHSDTNAEGRTRCAAYLKYFLDGASIAAYQGFFSVITNTVDTQDQPIKKISMLYSGPSFWGDVLLTKIWEDGQKDTICCEVSRDGDTLWEASLKYHPSDILND